MKDLLIVMNFTMRDMIKRKSFIISTIIFLIMIIVGFNIPNILKAVKGENSGDKLLIIDENNVFEGSLETLKNVNIGYEIEISNVNYEEIKSKIENEEVNSAILIEKQNDQIKVRYIVKDTTMMNDVPEDIISTINSLYSIVAYCTASVMKSYTFTSVYVAIPPLVFPIFFNSTVSFISSLHKSLHIL